MQYGETIINVHQLGRINWMIVLTSIQIWCQYAKHSELKISDKFVQVKIEVDLA